ncbi:MAG: PKD domain-containing protein [Thermoplasmata archaeon]|nr:PKD domain-containing protein [Thermoplasmata archaeon]
MIIAVLVLLSLPTYLHATPSRASTPPSSNAPVARPAAVVDPGAALLAAASRSLAAPPPLAGAPAPSSHLHPSATALTWHAAATNGSSPSARAAPALVYDPILGTVVLFGGYDPMNAADQDTWEYSAGNWTQLSLPASASPPGRWNANFVYDAADGYALLYGGRSLYQFFNDTWTFTSIGWSQLSPTHPPPAGFGSMAYDAKDSVVLLFGSAQGNIPGGSGSPWSDLAVTWEFHGGRWSNITSTAGTAPPAAFIGAMAYDPVDGYVLLYGGETAKQADSTGPYVPALTWSFSNGTWTNRTPSSATNSPGGAGGIVNTGLAYDPVLQGLILFGGQLWAAGGAGPSSETWEYVHGGWTNLTGSFGLSPPPRSFTPLAYDPLGAQLLVVGGGGYSGQYLGDTWALGPANGSPRLFVTINSSSYTGVAPLTVHLSANASQGIAPYTYSWSFGDGSANASGANVTHTFGSSGGFTVTVSATDSNLTHGSATALVSVLPHWALANAWSEVGGPNASVLPQPASRSAAALAYDPSLKEVVLFGGYAVNVSAYGDTWAFSNGSWTDLTTTLTSAPPARWEARLVWDAQDGYLLLFGGRDPAQFFNDTWSFSANGWTQLHPTLSPPEGWGQLAYDGKDGYVLLFSASQGNLPAGTYNAWVHWDITWKFVGGNWTNLTASVGTQPPGVVAGVMEYDAAAGYVLLFGGQTSNNLNGGCEYAPGLTWTYTQGHWTNRTPSSLSSVPGGSTGIANAAAAYDAGLGGVLLFGGVVPTPGGGCQSVADTWLYVNGSWSVLPSSAANPVPIDRQSFAMAYDAVDNESVIEGGNVYNSYLYLSDSWVFGPARSSLVAQVTVGNTIGVGNLTVEFTARAFGGHAPYRFNWSFGDGHAVTGTASQDAASSAHPAVYSPSLQVVDHAGHSVTTFLPQVRVAAAPHNTSPPTKANPTSSLGSVLAPSPLGIVVLLALVAGALLGGTVVAWWGRTRNRWRNEGYALAAGLQRGGPPPE